MIRCHPFGGYNMEQSASSYGGAKAILNLQPLSSIGIGYHSLFGSHDDLIFLELDEKLVPDVLQQRVTLKGEADEDAVLCTQSRTYAMKFVGTSNSSFLVPPSGQFTLSENAHSCDVKVHSQQVLVPVIKLVPGNMELIEVAPRLDKLKLLLLENPCSYEEVLEMKDVEKDNTRLYKWDNLIDRVQASNDELRTGLQSLSALEIDGYWRIVSDKCMDKILKMLLHNSVLNDWSIDVLNEDKVVSALASDGFRPELARHCLHVYGNKVDEGVGTSCVWRLDEKRVCVHFAREILRTGKKKMESFMGEWSQRIPDGMHASFEMLEGEVLTERVGVETWVHAFSAASLPLTPVERFSMLFKERSKWEWKDLQPYIRDLNVPGLSLEGLLLKYSRRTQATMDAEPVFSAR